MSQLVTRKTRSRRTSLDMEGSQISEERQISGGVKSCSVNVRSMKENPDSRVITEKQNALVIDDIIDDFDLEDELKEESVMDSENGDITETHFNGVKSSEQDSEKEQDSDCYMEDIEEDDEEEEDEELEEEVNDDEEYVQPNANKGQKKINTSTVKETEARYGKLWEFIRDLLKNEKYNPKIIMWEDIERGEFRIVDSVLVAKLWATVKKNKNMNYEKLSRAMRYYYKQNIFGIVENKRLVYRFGSKAKDWKPVGKSSKTQAASPPPERRCYNCLRLLESGASLKRHSETCTTNIVIPGNDNKNGIKVIQVQPKSQIQPEESKKRLSQKLFEIKAKEKEDEQYQKISRDFIRKISCKDDERRKIEPTQSSPKEDRKSLIEKEKEALESLMNLGASPSNLHQQATPLKALTDITHVVVSTPSSNQHLSNNTEKILFLKSASEKSKTQTILQKRVDCTSPVTNVILSNNFNTFRDKTESDDEVLIVDVVKPNESEDRIEAAAETVVKNQRLASLKCFTADNDQKDKKSEIPSSSKEQTSSVIPAQSPLLEGKLPARGKSIKINPKYSNFIPKKITTGNLSPALVTPPVEPEVSVSPVGFSTRENVSRPALATSLTPPATPTGLSIGRPSLVQPQPTIALMPVAERENSTTESGKKRIRINPKYSNFVAGKKPEDCGNIAVESSNPPVAVVPPGTSGTESVRANIKINPKYQTQHSKNVLLSSIPSTVTNNKGSPPSYEMAVSSNPKKTADLVQAVTEPGSSTSSLSPLPGKAPTLTTLLRKTKISDIRAKKVTAEAAEDDQPVSTNILKRRHSDTVVDLGESIPNLWKFLRALLHNPNYNPKLVAWENVDEGIFRIHNLQDFYSVWKSMKSTSINYDLWVKTMKLYDERGFIHSLEGHRCVYRFGVNAKQWKPLIGEVTMAGKRHFPNQATWPASRFYSEFNTSSVDPTSGVTTLFTLRPLDSTMTSMSELKVMSDNSSIVIPNDSRKNIIYSSPKTPVKRIKLTKTNGFYENQLDKSNNADGSGVPGTSRTESSGNLMELDCKLFLPSSSEQKAVLKFPSGVSIQLDRSLFSNMEKEITTSQDEARKILMQKRKSQAEEETKSKREAEILKVLMTQDNPVTPEQLREAVISKPLKFTKSSPEAGSNPRKLPTLLPKPVRETPLYTSGQSSSEIPAPSILLKTLEKDENTADTKESFSATVGATCEDVNMGNNEIQAGSEERDVEYSEEEFSDCDEAGYADDEEETLYIDDEAGLGVETQMVRRENVLRCKMYRDNKKIELKNSEKELNDLEIKHKQLKAREDFLDKSIEALHKFYINLINRNSLECPCEDGI